MALWIAVHVGHFPMDMPRTPFVALSGYVFSNAYRDAVVHSLPADTEQCPPRVLALGLDHADFLAAMAPKPVILLAKEKDFFDVRGAEEAFARLKHLYKLLDAEENVKMFVGPTAHGYSQENREAMYQWFNKATGVSDAITEPKLTIDPAPCGSKVFASS